MSAATTVGGGGSPQRESVPTDRPVNGEGENTALSDNSPTSTEPTKVCIVVYVTSLCCWVILLSLLVINYVVQVYF